MDQQKTGEFLKQLRKHKGLTQEQLAEQFCVSSRTISRWETGSNMPDVDVLIELADFYDVDIREIIDGKRKSEGMDFTEKDILKKVAAYATERERGTQTRMVYVALGVFAVLFVCTILFTNDRVGLLYGIIPAAICDIVLDFVYISAACLLVCYLRVRWWSEKPVKEPVKAVVATVVSKEVKKGTQQTGRSQGGYSFLINFMTEDNQMLEIYVYDVEFGMLREGTKGILTYQGRYFVDFTIE